jgi:hypothetical protein
MFGPREPPMNPTGISRVEAGVTVDQSLVLSLAREFGAAEQDVERILREELCRLAAQARISTFVTVLATSSARNRLRRQASRSH